MTRKSTLTRPDAVAYMRRPVKVRVNSCFYPESLDKMDECARALGCSRSDLLEYAFNWWHANAYVAGVLDA